MREVYIVDAVRTPVGRMGGTLKNTPVSYTHLTLPTKRIV